jgi:L-tyrosine isonitrile synthase
MAVFTEGAIKYEHEHSDTFTGCEVDHSSSQITAVAKNILTELMRFRRSTSSQPSCIASPCEKCSAPHLPKVVSAVERGEPVTLVLPAFPGKSPNLAKVFGPLPDMAERCALEFLQYVCDRIKRVYSPGARIILCSDGRVFSDVVGMRDEDVTAYREELSQIIADLELTSISTFNLEELYEGLDFDRMRSHLMEQYGEPIEFLKASVSQGGETHRLYCGITRFLVEDAMFPGQTKSRTAIQKECRIRAYEVIQRSQAWSELIEARFSDAVRLSIHPQGCGEKKLGIRLIEPDNWQTPWHGVAVDVGGQFVLLKRAQAEALGARLVSQMGRPSHYVLTEKEKLSSLRGVGYEA